MSNKYSDNTSCVQVIGCTLVDQSLLDDDGRYFYNEEDFVSEFHKVVFGALVNLHRMGAERVSTKDIEAYLENRPESKAVYNNSNGAKWIANAKERADIGNFDYYYSRVKKMTLLRAYDRIGIDVSFIYDPNEIFDVDRKTRQENYLDSLTLEGLADIVENKILDIKSTYVDDATDETVSIGEDVYDILRELEQNPEMGMPLYGRYVNTLHRGARLGKFYIRSAASGVGKSRTMIADACFISCEKMRVNNEWVSIGKGQPSLFITTELDKMEVTTMCLAFLSNVDEEHILKNEYEFGEKEAVFEAAEILSKSPLYIVEMPNFSMKDVENVIKRSIRTKRLKYIFFDYLHSSLGILQEISRASNGTKLREDNILFLFSVKLKDIATQFGVFVMTSTQLNGDWKTADVPDQNLLRGAKSIADRCDWGSIMLDVTPEDKEAIQNLVNNNGGIMPNVKLSVYKNRRGSYNKMFLWMYADKSTCRFNGLFATTYDYEPIGISETIINVEE